MVIKKIVLIFLFFICTEFLFGNEIFFKAISKGDLPEVKRLIEEEGENPNLLDEKGNNPLLISVKNGKYPIFEYLLPLTYNIDIVDEEEKSIVYYLIHSEKWEELEKFLTYKPNLEIKDSKNISPIGSCILQKSLDCVKTLHKSGASLRSFQTFQYYPLSIFAYINKQNQILEYLLKSEFDMDMMDSEGNTLLHKIVQANDIQSLSLIPEFKLNIEQESSKGETPYFFALEKKYYSIAEKLLELGADPFRITGSGRNVIHYYAPVNKPKVLKKFLTGIDKINQVDRDGFTPLGYSILANNKENTKILLENRADPNVKQGNREYPIGIALENLNLEIIKSLIEKKADPNVKTKNGKPLTLKAFELKRHDIFELLLNNGADPDEKFNSSPLILTFVENEKMEYLETLLKAGANVNLFNQDGETPLIIATKKGNLKLVKLLIRLKARMELKDNLGETAFFKAVESGNKSIISLFLENNVDIDDRNNKNESIFTKLVNNKELNTLEFILKQNVSPNISDKDGNSLIIELISSPETLEDLSNLKKALGILESYGINTNAKNKYGVTALEKAVLKSNFELVEVLVETGAGVNEPDKSGNTPLKKVILNYINSTRNEEDNLKIINYLIDKGASLNLPDRNKRTMLSEILIGHNDENSSKVKQMVGLLLKNGARVKIPDIKGKTGYEYAVNTKNEEIKQLVETYKLKEKDYNNSRDWANIQFGTSEVDIPLALDSDDNGDHIILGNFGYEPRIIRLNSRGKALWQIDSMGATGAVLDSKGNVYILGVDKRKFEGQKSDCPEGEDVSQFLKKIDSDGNNIFEKYFGKDGACLSSYSGSLHVSNKGLYALFQYKESYEIHFFNFDGKEVWSKILEEKPEKLKVDASGNLLVIGNQFLSIDYRGKIKNAFNFKFEKEEVKDFIISKSGEIYLTGQIENNPTLGIFLEKRDSKGRIKWKKHMSTEIRDVIKYIMLDESENVFLAGETTGEMHGSQKISPNNFLDYFVIKLNKNGKRLWTVQLGSDGNDYLDFFQLSQNKYPILAGSSSGRVPGGSYQGGEDITIFKLNEDGEPY